MPRSKDSTTIFIVDSYQYMRQSMSDRLKDAYTYNQTEAGTTEENGIHINEIKPEEWDPEKMVDADLIMVGLTPDEDLESFYHFILGEPLQAPVLFYALTRELVGYMLPETPDLRVLEFDTDTTLTNLAKILREIKNNGQGE